MANKSKVRNAALVQANLEPADGIYGITTLDKQEEIEEAPEGYYIVHPGCPANNEYFRLCTKASIEESTEDGYYLCYKS